MESIYSPVLVLNASYEPIHVCTARRALVLVCKGAAIVQETSGKMLRTSRITLPLPLVIRLLSYRNVPHHSRAVSRKAIMTRDQHTCQYCLSPFPAAKLTLDHVTPRSRGGGSTWENLVACCHSCNNKKGNRTPVEARMSLARTPRKLSIHGKCRVLSSGELWDKYLFY